MGSNGDVHDASAIMGQHHKDEQEAARHGRDDEEVERCELCPVILQEGAPGLRRWLAPADYVLRDRGLTDIDPEFQQLAVDSRRAPQGVRVRHRENQCADIG
jgi:hypothetical protein